MIALVLDLSLLAVVTVHLLLAPYTKVEESFNIQAIHDIVNYGAYPPSVLENFDHKQFPGVVPRTFVGSAVIGGVIKGADYVYSLASGRSFIADGSAGGFVSRFGDFSGQLHIQILARFLLGAANVWGFRKLRTSVLRISALPARRVATFYVFQIVFTFLLLSQFHVIFYATRTLPNFIILPVVNLGLSKIVRGDLSGFTWLAFCGVVFRLEVGVYATIVAVVSSLVFGQCNVFQAGFMLFVGSCVGLVTSYSVDSYFWGRATLPELEAFIFNVLQGKSVEWGVEPYSAYLKKYIVNFFRPPHVLLLCAFGFLRDPVKAAEAQVPKDTKSGSPESEVVTHPARNSLRILAISSVLYVLAMSFQPHKEWRFIVYIVPVFTLLAANGFMHLWARATTSHVHKFLILLVVASTFSSWAISTGMAYASSHNYPGGAAVAYVNSFIETSVPQNANVIVHMDVPACMTGITHFTELHRDNVVFDKTENEHELAKIWNDVDFLITHRNLADPHVSDLVVYDQNHWDLLTSVPAFAGIRLNFASNGVFGDKDGKFQSSAISRVFSEVKSGDFSSLLEIARSAVVLRDYLHIYKRTAPDVMPAIFDSGVKVEILDTEESLKKRYENELVGEIDPQDLRESVNEQIDEIEDLAREHLADEL